MYRKSVAGQLSGLDALLYPNVDWYDEVLKSSAPAQRYNASVRGGTRRMRYYASLEYYNQGSLFKELSNDPYGNPSSLHYRRYGFRANADFFLSKDLTLSVNFGTRFEERKGPNSREEDKHSEIYYQANHIPGWLFPVAYQAQNGETTKTLYAGTSQYQLNPYAILAESGYYKGVNTVNETNFIADYKMDWLTPGLSARAMMSFDYENYHRSLYSKSFATYELMKDNNGVPYDPASSTLTTASTPTVRSLTHAAASPSTSSTWRLSSTTSASSTRCTMLRQWCSTCRMTSVARANSLTATRVL